MLNIIQNSSKMQLTLSRPGIDLKRAVITFLNSLTRAINLRARRQRSALMARIAVSWLESADRPKGDDNTAQTELSKSKKDEQEVEKTNSQDELIMLTNTTSASSQFHGSPK
jgi:hypothetical protein